MAELKVKVPNSTDESAAKAQRMHVKIYTPFKVYYDGVADSLTAGNDTGTFDILPRHHNFMTLLNEGSIIVRHNGQEQTIAIVHGVMHVKADNVIVFLDV